MEQPEALHTEGVESALEHSIRDAQLPQRNMTQSNNPLVDVEKQIHWRPMKNQTNHSTNPAIPPIVTFTNEQFDALLLRGAVPKNIDLPPPFQGDALDNPHDFIAACEVYRAQSHCTSIELLKIATNCLRGKASLWWKPYSTLPLSWREFEERFLKKFDSAEIRATLMTQLYGQKQAARENAEIFLLRKIQLLRRLEIEQTAEAFIPVLVELLKPVLRPYLRMAPPTTIEELLDKVSGIEKDLEDQPPLPARDPRIRENTEPSLPRCNYCPGRHFNRDCPERPSNPRARPEVAVSANVPAARSHSQNWRQPTRAEAEQPPAPQCTTLSAANANNLPYLSVHLQSSEHAIQALIDSAATHNFINAKFVQNPEGRSYANHTAKMAQENAEMELMGETRVTVKIGNNTYVMNCIVAEALREDLILGLPWLTAEKVTFDFARRYVQHGAEFQETTFCTERQPVHTPEQVPLSIHGIPGPGKDCLDGPLHQQIGQSAEPLRDHPTTLLLSVDSNDRQAMDRKVPEATATIRIDRSASLGLESDAGRHVREQHRYRSCHQKSAGNDDRERPGIPSKKAVGEGLPYQEAEPTAENRLFKMNHGIRTLTINPPDRIQLFPPREPNNQLQTLPPENWRCRRPQQSTPAAKLHYPASQSNQNRGHASKPHTSTEGGKKPILPPKKHFQEEPQNSTPSGTSQF